MNTRPTVTSNPWQALRRFTAARIALGRAGTSLPMDAHLASRLAHARARDAVHLPFDAAAVAAALDTLGLATVRLHSAAGDRHTYLQRPDLGRRLGAKHSHSSAMASICNDERASYGVMSGHDRKTLSL